MKASIVTIGSMKTVKTFFLAFPVSKLVSADDQKNEILNFIPDH